MVCWGTVGVVVQVVDSFVATSFGFFVVVEEAEVVFSFFPPPYIRSK